MPIATQAAEPVAAICACTAVDAAVRAEAMARLAARFGPWGHLSAVFAFDMTTYYEAEMGPDLHKQLWCWSARVDPAVLPQLKHGTMDVERELARLDHGTPRRRVNLDPGLVSLDSLVLATTKAAGHRVCIAPDLYAEVTLLYQSGAYRPLPWSYRDYQAPPAQAFLQQTRQWLKAQRQAAAT